TADFTNWIAYIAQTGVETETVDQWYNDVSGLTFSQVNYSPWIVMNVSANPSSILNSSTSIVTADFTHNSNGDDISTLGSIPDGLVVNFTSDSLGTVNPLSSTTINGKAITTYTAGTTTGTSNVNANANNQTGTTSINVTGIYVPVAVVSTDPVNGTLNVSGNKVLTIIFNVPIKAGSAYSGITVMNTNENSAKDIVTNISGNTLTITPTYNWLQFVKYTLTIPANSITDLTGNNLLTLTH
ncbi:MAG: Ig-like domain-containing protein, partial [Methanobacterium sp.]|uniref:Ig-like domain-containing protein n=1 Tax=Methanobacterium sp. TaxID=2164 RepID=UPI003C762257